MLLGKDVIEGEMAIAEDAAREIGNIRIFGLRESVRACGAAVTSGSVLFSQITACLRLKESNQIAHLHK